MASKMFTLLNAMVRQINTNKCPPNLLDNPDFAVAQAGHGGWHGDDTYAADRWLGRNTASTVYAALKNGGIKIIGGQWACKLQQKLAAKSLRGKKITAGLKLKSSVGRAWATLMAFDANGNELANSTETIVCPMETVFAFSLVVPESAEYVVFTFDNNMEETATIEINWAALYEGTYTAETLPQFVPPDPTLELAKCQEQFFEINKYSHVGNGYVLNEDAARITIVTPAVMRTIPSLNDNFELAIVSNGKIEIVAAPNITIHDKNGNLICLSVKINDFAANMACAAFTTGTAKLQLNAGM